MAKARRYLACFGGTALGLLVLTCCAGLSLWALARRGVQADADLAYGAAAGQRLLLDVYLPRGKPGGLPAVVLIHGGGWRGGSKADNRAFAQALARAGFVAFSVDYRLVTPTGNKYPAQFDDVQRAVRWIRAHAAGQGIDPGRVGAFGHSAGGHLAALLGTRETRDNSDPELASHSSRVQCVVCTCGPTDFTDPANPPLFPAHMHLVTALFGKRFEEARDLYRDGSPLAHVDGKAAPFLLLHGADDTYVPLAQSRRFHAALRQAGVEATLLVLENDGHLCQRPEHQKRWLDETVAFFRRHLGG
jgi:acetyl esterase/lipase